MHQKEYGKKVHEQLQRVELSTPEPPNKQTQIRDLFTGEVVPPKVYSLEDAGRPKKPISCYLPVAFRRRVVGASPDEKIFSYNDLCQILRECKGEMAQEVIQYYNDMVTARVNQERQRCDLIVKRVQSELQDAQKKHSKKPDSFYIM